MGDYVEPVAAALWFQRIDLIASGALGCVENSLRHASHLLQLTPLPLRPLIGPSVDDDTFEALLDAADFDTAARYLVAQPTALTVEEEGKASLVRATIRCAVLNRNITGTGETVANAVLNAWTTCLLAIRMEYGPDLFGLGHQSSPDDPPRAYRRSVAH